MSLLDADFNPMILHPRERGGGGGLTCLALPAAPCGLEDARQLQQGLVGSNEGSVELDVLLATAAEVARVGWVGGVSSW